MDGAVFLVIVGVFIALATQGFRLGQPFIKMEYCAGRRRYYVWIRRFMGYNDLAGSCDTEQQAKNLLETVKQSPPKTI